MKFLSENLLWHITSQVTELKVQYDEKAHVIYYLGMLLNYKNQEPLYI